MPLDMLDMRKADTHRMDILKDMPLSLRLPSSRAFRVGRPATRMFSCKQKTLAVWTRALERPASARLATEHPPTGPVRYGLLQPALQQPAFSQHEQTFPQQAFPQQAFPQQAVSPRQQAYPQQAVPDYPSSVPAPFSPSILPGSYPALPSPPL